MNQTEHTARKAGLNDAEVAASRATHGSNRMTPPKKRGFLSHFFQNLGDPVIRILLGALLLNIVFLFRTGNIIETIGIGVSVFLATFISTLSEYGSENAFSRLNELNENYPCRVLRNGRGTEVPTDELVVGDTVLLSAGDKIPADGFLVRGRLSVDQSAMTGETREVEKTPGKGDVLSPASRDALLRECVVTAGDGEMEVTVVGDRTFIGEISREIRLDTRQSPLAVRLARLAGQISRLGYAAAILVGLAYLVTRLVAAGSVTLSFYLTAFLDAFTLGLTVIVVAVPEGLPMMIAVVLSSNIKKMTRDKVLVRKPVGIEAAGSMNILFTDKTGTITEGILNVTGYFNDRERFPSLLSMKKSAPDIFVALRQNILWNTCAVISDGKPLGGNGTEQALLRDMIPHAAGKQFQRISFIPFDSTKKTSSAVIDDGKKRLLIKGAPERLLPRIRYSLGGDGALLPFDRDAFLTQLSRETKSGARVILTAIGTTSDAESADLTLVCAVSMTDRLRPEAGKSVESLHTAGIRVVMITGDNPDTAASIAERCGILNKDASVILTGEEMATLDDAALTALLPRLAVIARALPNDKSRLVRLAQEAGLVCGMTGDGINDAPALRRADIGFAMGSGTQVAKEAGDIIILDNNLSSIVRAVLFGRNIFKSIRKFIVLQLTMNLCAVGVSMIGPFIGVPAPVTVVQMLWINIIMDTLGGLAFAGEPPLPSCMKEAPKRRDEPILNSYMVHQIVCLGSFTIALSVAFLKSSAVISHFRATENDLCHLTAFFAFFIFASVFNCFGARTDRLDLLAGISKNKPFLTIMALIAIIQIGFVYLGGTVLRTMPLYPGELLYTLFLSLGVVPAEFIRKLVWKLFIRKQGY